MGLKDKTLHTHTHTHIWGLRNMAKREEKKKGTAEEVSVLIQNLRHPL